MSRIAEIPTFVLVQDERNVRSIKALPEPIRVGAINPIAQALLNGDVVMLECDTKRAIQLTAAVKKRGFRVHIRPVPENPETHVYVWADKSSAPAREAKP